MNEIARLDDWRHPVVDAVDPAERSEPEQETPERETLDGLVGEDALRAILELVGAPVPDRLLRRPRVAERADRRTPSPPGRSQLG